MLREWIAPVLVPLVLFTAVPATAEVKTPANTADLVAVDVAIDDSGALVAVIQNAGIAVNTPFQGALTLDGTITRSFGFSGATRGTAVQPSTTLVRQPSTVNLALPFQAGERRTLRFTDVGVGICSGNHVVMLALDTGQAVAEVSESNNAMTKNVTAPCPDLAVQSITKNYNSLRTEYVAEVVVVNQGTGRTPHFSIATQATPGGPIGPLPDGGATQYPGLAPGQTLKLRTGAASALESLRVKVWLDVGNTVKESNKNNNVVEKLLTP